MTVPTTNYPIRIGLQLAPQHTTYREVADAVRKAEDLGVDSIWNWDHFFPLYGDPDGPHFEGWTLLTAMATLTTRARIGCLVTCNTYRNPALLSNMAKTVDHISDGRLILGLGAGWFDRDYREFGYDFGTAGGRLAALEEALPIIQHRWKVDKPAPVQKQIPILIGGGGERKTLRITAKYASMWHGFGDVETFKHKSQVLDQWCAEVGRNPQEIERCSGVSPDATEKTFEEFASIGVTHFILGSGVPVNFELLQRLIRWRDSR